MMGKKVKFSFVAAALAKGTSSRDFYSSTYLISNLCLSLRTTESANMEIYGTQIFSLSFYDRNQKFKVFWTYEDHF